MNIEQRLNRNKYGTEVRPGQVWQDCDERMDGRRRKVLRVKHGRAYMDGYPKTTLAVRRMHPGSRGWKLVKDVQP